MAEQKFPTWMIVVAIIILIPPIVWAMSLVVDILVATSIGFVIAVVLIVLAFRYLNKRVNG